MQDIESRAHEQACGDKKRQIRVYVISDYVMPLAMAMQQYGADTDIVLLIESKSKRGQVAPVKAHADYLHKQNGWNIEVKDIKIDCDGDANYDDLMQNIEERVRKWAGNHPRHQMVFDITGGTKVMALVLHDIARKLADENIDASVSYTSTDAEQFQWLYPERHQQQMQVSFDIRRFLEISGYTIDGIDSENSQYMARMAERRHLTENTMAALSADAVGCLNGWAHAASEISRRNGKNPGEICVEREKNPNLAQKISIPLLQDLKQAGALDYSLKNGDLASLTFTRPDWARYLSGGWLEEWAWWQVEGLPGLDRGLGVRINKRGALNELDLVLCYRNRLLVVEAKTAALKGKTARKGGNSQGVAARGSKESEVIYKIGDIATRLSHQAYGTKVLISWQPLSQEALKRARQGLLHVVANHVEEKGTQNALRPHLPGEFRAMVEEWMTQGRLRRKGG